MADKAEESVDTDAGKIVRRWMTALEDSDRWMQNYMERCKRIIRRYRNERPMGEGNAPPSPDIRRFAILWSNIQTLGPAIYARTPNPVVTRRYKDSNPVGRYASEVLERALSYSMDQYEFDDHIKLARDDFLLLARATVWVRYIPHQAVDDERNINPQIEIEDEGPSITDTAEYPTEVPYAEVVCDHVAYNNWGMERCRSWDETGYVWRRVFMSRQELIERFGRKIGREVPLDYTPAADPTMNSEEIEKVKKAAVYEIWSKEDRKVYWVNRSYPKQCLDIKDDWLKLQGFFPCPRPMIGTTAPDSYIPVPDYVQYQDQAEELDELTQRIATLVDGLKMIGIYAGEEEALLQNLFMQPSLTMVPVQSMASWSERGGFKGLVEWMPIDMVATTLKECIDTRKQILEDIYQITGMSDIIRGMSDPRETATAQQMKGNWGSLRVRDKQKEIERFARDVLRLQAEIIAGQFGVSTLKLMTDVKLFDTVQQKQAVQRALQPPAPQQPAMPGMPPQQAPAPLPLPPGVDPQEMQQMMQRPTWEEVDKLLKNTAQRSFQVDVETDSTIEPNQQEEKLARVEFITAFGQYIAAVQPLLTASPQSAPMVGQIGLYLVRGFRAGREVEDTIEQYFETLAQSPPKELGQKPDAQTDPGAVQVAQLGVQQETIKQQGAAQVQQLKLVGQQQEAPIRQAELQLQAGDQQLRAAALQRDPNPQAVSNG